MSCASTHQSWSGAEAEEAEWRWRRWSGGGGSQRQLEAGEEGEGRAYHDIMSWTTPNSIMTWCMRIMEPLSQDTLDDGRHWNWGHGTTGGQGCPGMLPSSLWDAMHATRQRPSLHRRWGN